MDMRTVLKSPFRAGLLTAAALLFVLLVVIGLTKLPSIRPSESLAALPSKDAQTTDSQQATAEGRVELLHFDDTTTRTSRNEYYLVQGTQRTQLIISDTVGQKLAGATVRVRDLSQQGKITVDTNATSVEILKPAVEEQRETLGVQKVLVLLTSFEGAPQQPFSALDARKFMFKTDVQNFFKENSYNKMWLDGDVYGWIHLPRVTQINGNCVFPGPYYQPEFDTIIQNNNIDLSRYSRVLFLMNTNPEAPCQGGNSTSIGKTIFSSGGNSYSMSVATVNTGPYSWEYTSGVWNVMYKTIAHELGHGLGLLHSGSLECGPDVSISEYCAHIEYGNIYDVMGSPFNYQNGSFNARQKDELHWLGDSLLTITRSGRYTINSLESSSGIRAAKIQPAGHTTAFYFLENRKAIGIDRWLDDPQVENNQKGLLVNTYFYSGPHLLDMTPVSSDFSDWLDASLNPGAPAFTDPLGITMGSVVESDTKIAFDVNIAMPPVSFTLSASQTSGQNRVDTAFTGIYNHLSCPSDQYYLDFGDGTPPLTLQPQCGGNPYFHALASGQMAPVSHLYSTPGTYTATLSAAGIASNTILITVLPNMPPLEIMHPKGGEVFAVGKPVQVRWSNGGAAASQNNTIDIDITSWSPPCSTKTSPCPVKRTFTYSVAKNILDSGTYEWTAGKSAQGSPIPNGQYVMRITRKSTGQYTDTSVPFTLKGTK